MFQHINTLTDIILQEERENPKATGGLTLLLTRIEDAAKIIASHVHRTGLVDILGKTGNKNAYDEDVQKLDDYCNALLVKTLLESGQVYAIASEELPDIVYARQSHQGNYIVFFDPLDGSSNIDINSPIGTIFSIYRKSDKAVLQKGEEQIAAGYILYGPSTVFVYASLYSVNGFTLDPSVGSFLLSSPNITIPKKGNIYSINEGNSALYDDALKKYLAFVKEKNYKARYIGTMVADVHRTLLKGGIFLYPNDKKHPEGKLRLLFEVNPMSFIMEKAGGKATVNGIDPLTIQPKAVNHRVPIAIGSKENIEEYLKITHEAPSRKH